MMANLDQISQAIGQLQTATTQLQATAAQHSDNDLRMQEKLEVQLTSIAKSISCLPAMKARLEKIEPAVDSLLATRQRTFGIAAGVSAVVTGIGVVAHWIFRS